MIFPVVLYLNKAIQININEELPENPAADLNRSDVHDDFCSGKTELQKDPARIAR